MFIRVDARQIPPLVTLCEQDDFRRFHVVVHTDSQVWIDPNAVRQLAVRPDEQWEQGFAGMLAFAADKGWVDDSGRIAAHVEITDVPEGDPPQR